MKAIVNYFKESWREIGRISWPNRKLSIRLTLAVIVFSLALALFMGAVDLGFSELVKKVLLRE